VRKGVDHRPVPPNEFRTARRIGLSAAHLLGCALCLAFAIHVAWADPVVLTRREAKELTALKKWSDGAIAAELVTLRNSRLELGRHPVRHFDPLQLTHSIETNTVLFQVEMENKTGNKLSGLVLEISLFDKGSGRDILHKRVFMAVELYPTGKLKSARAYYDPDLARAMSTTDWRWRCDIRFLSPWPEFPPVPDKRWFGPRDPLESLRPVEEWAHSEEVPFVENATSPAGGALPGKGK
jgi:hypothetical protein